MCYYGDVDIYGALYTWSAAANGEISSYNGVNMIQGVCPSGWHLPSDDEWIELESNFNFWAEDLYIIGYYRGKGIGSILAGNESLWGNGYLDEYTWFGSSGFMALPAGYRNMNGILKGIRENACFWSSTIFTDSTYFFRKLDYYNTKVLRDYTERNNGFSVRCVKD